MEGTRGTTRTDGWTRDEISVLPTKMKKKFNEMNKRWEKTGKTPRVMEENRQPNLSKPGQKNVEKNPITNNRIRPIETINLDEPRQYIVDMWEDLWKEQNAKYEGNLDHICEEMISYIETIRETMEHTNRKGNN